MFIATDEQQAVIDRIVADYKYNVLTNATAGSGKSSVLEASIRKLVERGADPTKMLFTSFSNIAIQQMSLPKGVVSMTTTKLGFAIMRPYFNSEENEGHKGWGVKRYDDKYDMIVYIAMKDLGYDKDDRFELKNLGIRQMMDYVRQDLSDDSDSFEATWDRHFKSDYPQEFTQILLDAMDIGIDWYRRGNYSDMLDALWLPNVLNMPLDNVVYYTGKTKAGKKVGKRKARRIKETATLNDLEFLACDEYQDASEAEIALMTRFHTELGTQLVFVGDMKQSIYRWRGASRNAFASAQEYCDFDIVPIRKTRRSPRSHTEYIRTYPVDDRFLEPNIFSLREDEGTLGTFDHLSEVMDKVVPQQTLIVGRNVKGANGKILEAIKYITQHTDYSVSIEGVDTASLTKRLLTVMDENNLNVGQAEVAKNIIIMGEQERIANEDNYYCNIAELEEQLDFSLSIVGICYGCNTTNDVRNFIANNLNNPLADIVVSTTFKAKGRTFKVVVSLESGPLFDSRNTDDQNDEEENVFFVAVTRSSDVLYVANPSE